MSKQKIIDKLEYWIQTCANIIEQVQSAQSEQFHMNILRILEKLDQYQDELNFATLPQSFINDQQPIPIPNQMQQQQQNASVINLIRPSQVIQQQSQINPSKLQSQIRQRSQILQVSNIGNYNIRNYLNVVDLQTTRNLCHKCGQVKMDQNIVRLGCGHEFHETCINNLLQEIQYCPVCNQRLVSGFSMPDGQMEINIIDLSCNGYEQFTTIEIQYKFQGGYVDGKTYNFAMFVAYIPDNQEGNDLVDALKVAFTKRATFYLKQEGNNYRLDWLIPHKTQLHGGGYQGYPDKEYIPKTLQKLRSMNII